MGFEQLHPALQHHVVNSLGWPRLRPLQEQAIEPLLEGEDAILLAPTAGGKTEAAFFPVLSRMLVEDWRGLSVIYVCPIKALLNNLLPRLQYLAGLLGRRVELWHGDVGESARNRIRKDPPDVLLTTPESVEAILVSAKSIPREFFRGVRTAVIDEVHAFAGDDRGWHLLGVLSRVEEITGAPIQRIGLSATVGNPDELLTWLSPDGRTGQVLNPPAEVATEETEVVLDFVGSIENAALVISQLHRGCKRLVFCDSRARVEALAVYLREHNVTTFVSHSSLGLQERRDAEQAFSEGRDCVIVATSTLELGIDVGDLDFVIQIDSPPTIAGFLQRLGRTGRRKGSTRNCLFLATKSDALIRAAALIRLWRSGFIEPVDPPPLPLHILSQQIMGLALQERGVTRESWLKPTELFRSKALLTRADGEQIIDAMLKRDLLVEDAGVLWFGKTGEARFGRRHFMDLMAVFATEPLLSVRHGRLEVGQIHPLSITSGSAGAPISLGGRSWAILEVDWPRKRVAVQPTQGRGKVLWLGDAAPLGIEQCMTYRDVLVDDQCDPEWTARAKRQITTLREEFCFLRRDLTTLQISATQEQTWWTFGGLLANVQLSAWLKRTFGVDSEPDNYRIRLATPQEPGALAAAMQESKEAGGLQFMPDEEFSSRLKFDECLPEPLKLRELEARYSAAGDVHRILSTAISVVNTAGGDSE
jgi:ATP-dependent Lhr-like helicase